MNQEWYYFKRGLLRAYRELYPSPISYERFGQAVGYISVFLGFIGMFVFVITLVG